MLQWHCMWFINFTHSIISYFHHIFFLIVYWSFYLNRLRYFLHILSIVCFLHAWEFGVLFRYVIVSLRNLYSCLWCWLYKHMPGCVFPCKSCVQEKHKCKKNKLNAYDNHNHKWTSTRELVEVEQFYFKRRYANHLR